MTRRWRRRIIADAIARLHPDAEAVAAEHGHVLGEWHRTRHLLTSARCTQCTATVCLRVRGAGSNADPLRWLARDCRPVLDRFYAVKSTIGPATHFIHDRENPTQTIAMVRKAADVKKRLAQLNGGEVDERAKLIARVTRLRAQLVKAEAALAAFNEQEVPNGVLA